MMNLYKHLGKLLYYLLYPVLRFASSTFGGKRVRVLVMSENGNTLLVKSWLGRQRWSLPGGGINHNESPEQAAVRELLEETGLQTHVEALEYLGKTKGAEGIPFPLEVFRLQLNSEVLEPLSTKRQYEIIECKWWPVADLPDDISPVVAWSLKR